LETLILTIAMFGLLMLAMAVGVIFKGRELKGSCGGVGGAECVCEREGTPRACDEPGTGKQAGPGIVVYD
jgi:hypothetical protein